MSRADPGRDARRPASPAERDRAAAARGGHRALPARDGRGDARRCGRELGPARRASWPSTRAGCCGARGSRRCSRPSPPVAGRAAGLGLVLVGSGEGQALSVEDELRRRVGRARPRGRASSSPGGSSAWRTALRAADVFVFPSVFEALGISLVEAAACGLPAVASRTGGIVDVVEDGARGCSSRPGDARGARRGPASASPADAALRARDGARGARHRPRALRRARRGRALPGPLPRGQLSAGFFIPAGTCSSCRWSSSSITGRSSLKEK